MNLKNKKTSTPLEIQGSLSLFKGSKAKPPNGSVLSITKSSGKFLTGFTLIELTVVMIIVAILVIVAFAGFQGAVDRGRDASVISALGKIQTESGMLFMRRRDLEGFSINPVVRSARETVEGHLGVGAMNNLHYQTAPPRRSFCVWVRLLDGRHWCVDNTPFSGVVTTPIHCTRTVGATGGTYRCRP